jgi:hypothetical protein
MIPTPPWTDPHFPQAVGASAYPEAESLRARYRLAESEADREAIVIEARRWGCRRGLIRIDRWYLRCADCLSVVAIEEDLRKPACVCGGTFETMGRVQQDGRLVEDRLEAVCDGRCTHALGPFCICHCGGLNHGSQRIVHVERDVGGEPRLAPIDREAAIIRATEFRAALALARAAVEGPEKILNDLRNGGRFLGQAEWSRYMVLGRLRQGIWKAQRMKVHKARMAKLAEIAGAA